MNMFLQHAELKAKLKTELFTYELARPFRVHKFKNKLYIIIIIYHYFYWVVNQIMLRTCERKQVLFKGKK